MGLRSTLTRLLSAPTALLLETALEDLIDEILDAEGFVRKSELVALEEQVDGLRRALAQRRSDLGAVQQALAAWNTEAEDLDLDDDAPSAADLARKLDLASGAVAATAQQLQDLRGQLGKLESRTEQAHQVATSARATAEAAADGVTGLENRLAEA